MPDNVNTGTGVPVATDVVTYSGDPGKNVQLMRIVQVTGAEDSKTVVDLPGDSTNGLDVDVTRMPWSVVSAVNSSTSTLGAGAAFTGTSEEVKDYASIQISVIASHASATDGLAVQQSSDGTNWDIVDTYTIAAATGKTFSFQPVARYFRVVYTNGGTLQTYFRLQTVFHYHAPKPSSQRAANAYSNETDLQQVWAFNSYWNGSNWDLAAGNTAGAYNQGNVAHDAVDSGNPVKIGARAVPYAAQSAVAAGDRHDLICDRHGSLFVIGGHPDIQTFRTRFTAAQTNVALVTVAAGSRIILTSLGVRLDNASTVFPSVLIGFGAATTPTGAQVVEDHPGVAAGGGANRGDGSGIIGVGADDEDLRITTVGTATGNGMSVVGTYYTIPG
jgi:hypothetical protein